LPARARRRRLGHHGTKAAKLLHPRGYRYFSMLREKLRWHERSP
jgi:hypothetical protein